ncbi:MAG: hypothetical protein R2825_00945 [Saprospiraceae bacterium]
MCFFFCGGAGFKGRSWKVVSLEPVPYTAGPVTIKGVYASYADINRLMYSLEEVKKIN